MKLCFLKVIRLGLLNGAMTGKTGGLYNVADFRIYHRRTDSRDNEGGITLDGISACTVKIVNLTEKHRQQNLTMRRKSSCDISRQRHARR